MYKEIFKESHEMHIKTLKIFLEILEGIYNHIQTAKQLRKGDLLPLIGTKIFVTRQLIEKSEKILKEEHENT